MTIQRGNDLLNQSNPNADELRKSIAALKWQRPYVQNSINIGIRDEKSGQENVDEMSELIQKLEEKLKCSN
jgi:lipid II:glycine glycyltransferase (peptidoglycan interpeptide bridge formation enzyme)